MDSTSPIARRIAGKSSIASGSMILFAMVLRFLTPVEKRFAGRPNPNSNPRSERRHRHSHRRAAAGHGQ